MMPDVRVVILLALQPVAFLVWSWQNSRPGALGGPVSLVKSFWLIYAVSLWLVLPLLWWSEHWVFRLWAISMVVRSGVEVPLCLTRRWKVAYGVGHDAVHLAFVAVGLALMPQFRMISVLTAVSLVSELVFVHWFRARTAGPDEGVYFVPGDAAYRDLNRKTCWIFLPQYAAFWGWMLLAA